MAVNLLLTAGVILFITFPSALFNHTLQANYEEIRAVWERRSRQARRLRERVEGGNRREQGLMVTAVALVGALLNGLLNPHFGLDLTSVVTDVATPVTIGIGITAPAVVAHSYRRVRRRDRGWHLQPLPVGLAFAGLCVLVSRVTGFEPGYFYGLVCGLAFGTQLARHEAGHTASLAAVTTMLLAVLAWVGWSAVHVGAANPGAAAPLVFIDDVLASVFVGGLVGNVVGLLPLSFLQGGTLAAWHRGAWFGDFGLATFGLIQVLLHPESGAVHLSTAPLVTAVIQFVGFGGLSPAFNRYFTWPGRPTRLQRPAPPDAAAQPAVPNASAPVEPESADWPVRPQLPAGDG